MEDIDTRKSDQTDRRSRRQRRIDNARLADNPVLSLVRPDKQDFWPGPTHLRKQADFFVPLVHISHSIINPQWLLSVPIPGFEPATPSRKSEKRLRAAVEGRILPRRRNLAPLIARLQRTLRTCPPATRALLETIDQQIRVFAVDAVLQRVDAAAEGLDDAATLDIDSIPVLDADSVPVLDDDGAESLDWWDDADTINLSADESVPADIRSVASIDGLSTASSAIFSPPTSTVIPPDRPAVAASPAVVASGPTANFELDSAGRPQLCVFAAPETDRLGRFIRFLVHAVAEYYGIGTWSVTVQHPAGAPMALERWRRAYVGVGPDAPVMRVLSAGLSSVPEDGLSEVLPEVLPQVLPPPLAQVL